MSITNLTATQLSVAIQQRQLRCVEVMQSYLGRIAELNPVYNAIVSMADEQCLIEQAERADDALSRGAYWGWMHGMPYAVKDLANVKGFETSMGSPIMSGVIAQSDDIHIARIRNQGAIFIGKTNVPEFGLGSHTFNPVFGTTRCGLNAELSAGGSSGGAGSALATRMLPVADGSDMMGSLRNPAAFNDVIGFRPSVGRVPRTSSKGMFDSDMVTAGPMGRNVEDTVRLMLTMAGFDQTDPMSLQESLPSYNEFEPRQLQGLRIGWLGDFNGHLAMEAGILTLCESKLAALIEQGANVEPSLPDFDMQHLWRAWVTLRQHTMAGMQEYLREPKDRDRLSDDVVWEIENGVNVSSTQVNEAEAVRNSWRRCLASVFQHYDLLALPAAQVFPFKADIDWPRAINDRKMDTYHRWMEVSIAATLSGFPVVSLPAGFDDTGRPAGLQFIGAMAKDKEVMEFAMAYEACI
ncbi:MAG: amidase [Pseudomonadota bacterium]